MKKLAVLGPKGTYSDLALNELVNKDEYEITYYPSILKVLKAMNMGSEAVLPLENSIDGFVMESLDGIIDCNFEILNQVKLPITFSVISNQKIEEVDELYVQFKAYGQCLHFIGDYQFKIQITQSNMESLIKFEENSINKAAIVPTHVINKKYQTIINNIEDNAHNETRFVHIGKKEECEYSDKILASVVITALEDRPGVLFNILERFNRYHFNMKAILSRPRRDEIGKYKFYIEFECLSKDINNLEDLLLSFRQQNDIKIKLLGICNAL